MGGGVCGGVCVAVGVGGGGGGLILMWFCLLWCYFLFRRKIPCAVLNVK